jgi:sulfopyruvate decarboxylase subunit alpha
MATGAGAVPDTPTPQAAVVLDALEELEVTHVVGLPDNASASLFSQLDDRPAIRRVYVTREGEAFALASGLWVGGATPAVVIQNTGLLESGDSLRGTAMRMGVPLLCFVTVRGFASLPLRKSSSRPRRQSREVLVRPEVDSAAVLTEPTLKAWRVPFNYYESDDHRSRIRDAMMLARAEDRPVVLLLSRGLT